MADGNIRVLPGANVADGRYRLLVFHGGPKHLQFWQALDATMGRQVALTLVDPEGALPPDEVHEILSSTARLRGIYMPGLARVLEVAGTGRGGLVASEWIRGATLREVADSAPSPLGVAGAVQPLVAAAEAAHRTGVALCIDHPDRMRLSTEGDVVLAFPAVMPDGSAHDDLRGIGAALYALLLNRWPSRQNEVPTGWADAEPDQEGRPKEPAAVDSKIPFLVSATATGLLRESGGIRSAETVLALLQRASGEADHGEPEPPVREPPPLPPPGGYASFHSVDPSEAAEARRRQGMLTALGVGAAVIVVVAMMLASTLIRIVGNGGAAVALDKDKLGLHTPTPAPAQPAPVGTVAGAVVKPVRATVFSPGGTPDSPKSAGLTIDGDPATAWATDTYLDAVPFPKFKDGVGLLLQLPQPSALSAVAVDLDSTGTVVQIRSSSTATPGKLADTTELTPPTPTRPGHNSIPVKSSTATQFVLVWISTLGTTNGKSHTDISEVTLQGASLQ